MSWLRTIVICTAVCLVPAAFADAAIAPPGQRAATAALTEVGVPFAWGGTTPATGFDTPGLVAWAFAQAGVPGLPHFTGALWNQGQPVSRNHLRRGDLVFFDDGGHVGIYLGHGRFIHAPGTGRGVAVASLSGRYLRSYTGAVRI